jgi:hypothetical protein
MLHDTLPGDFSKNPMIINNSNLGIMPLPDYNENEFNYVPTQRPLTFSKDGFSSLPVADSFLLDKSYEARSIDRSFEIFARDKAATKMSIRIGRVAEPATNEVRFSTSGPRKHTTLILQPAVAAVANTMRDRNYVAAINAVNAMFSVGSEPKLGANVISAIGTLLESPPDPTRYLFRLAQLFCLCKFSEAAGHRFQATARVTTASAVNSLTSLSALLSGAMLGQQIAVVDLSQFFGDKVRIMSALQAAAGELAVPAHLDGVRVPQILRSAVQTPDVSVAYISTDRINTYDPNMDSVSVWTAACIVAGQWGCAKVWEECVDTVMSLMYSTKPGRDEVYSAEVVYLTLPALSLAHYALLPISLACEALPDAPALLVPEFGARMAELVLRNQVLSVAYGEVLYSLGSYATDVPSRTKMQRVDWLKRAHTGRAAAPVVIMQMMVDAASSIVNEIQVSATFASLRPMLVRNELEYTVPLLRRCTQWEELVDVLPNLPVSALDSILKPKRTSILPQPGIFYRIESLGMRDLPSVTHLISQCAAQLSVASRSFNTLNWNLETITPALNYRGAPVDHALPMVVSDKLERNDLVVRFPNKESCMMAWDRDEAQRTWTWFISGNTMAVQGDLGGPTYDHSPPFGYKLPDDNGELQKPETAVAGPWSDTSKESARLHTSDRVSAELADSIRRNKEEMVAAAKEAVAANTTRFFTTPEIAKLADNRTRVWLQEVTENLPEGVFPQLVQLYANIKFGYTPSSHEFQSFWTPYIRPIADALPNVSIGTALGAAPMKRRAGLAAVLSTVACEVAKASNNSVSTTSLIQLGIRADLAAKALRDCPALSIQELVELGFVVPDASKEFLEMTNQTGPVEAGIPLSNYAVRDRAMIVEVKSNDTEEIKRLTAQGWKPTRTQKDPDLVRMAKQNAAVLSDSFDFEACFNYLMSTNTEIEMRVSETVDRLRAEAEKQLLEHSKAVDTAVARESETGQKMEDPLPQAVEPDKNQVVSAESADTVTDVREALTSKLETLAEPPGVTTQLTAAPFPQPGLSKSEISLASPSDAQGSISAVVSELPEDKTATVTEAQLSAGSTRELSPAITETLPADTQFGSLRFQ